MNHLRATKRRVAFAMALAFVALVIYDYVSYHRRYDAAMSVVSRLDGRAGSLFDWPFGRECRVTFDRPVTAEELSELAVLNALAGRHAVGVAFDCEMRPAQLQAARETLTECVVTQVDQ